MKSIPLLKVVFSSCVSLSAPLFVGGEDSSRRNQVSDADFTADDEVAKDSAIARYSSSKNDVTISLGKIYEQGSNRKSHGHTRKSEKETREKEEAIDIVDEGSLVRAESGKYRLPNGSGASFESHFIHFVVENEGQNPPKPLKKPSPRLPRKKNEGRARKLAKGRSKTKGTKSAKTPKNQNRVTKAGCVQGTSSFVTETCEMYNCCSGPDACKWSDDDIATVCPSSCNGEQACYYIGGGTFVDFNSCNGKETCRLLAMSSTQPKSKIGKNSCRGDYACFQMCFQSPDCEVTIGEDACIGYGDCGRMGQNSKDLHIINIGDGSCVSGGSSAGFAACDELGKESVQEIKVGKNSCQGTLACFSVGQFSEDTVMIGEYSCRLGHNSCSFLGFDSRADVRIGDESCTAELACIGVGRRLETEGVSVSDNACSDFKSCYFFAQYVETEAVEVQEGECTLVEQCSGVANPSCAVTARVPNDDGMCPTD